MGKAAKPIGALVLAATLALWSPIARAHAIIVSATPANGAVIAGSELAIEIRFNARVDSRLSRLTLATPDGGSVILPLADGAPDALQAKASGLAPGAYRLHWQTLSVDGHLTQGDISFEMGR